MQGIVFRPGDRRFERRSVEEAMSRAASDPDCVMINRNRGSGTRVLVDLLLKGARPAGYAHQARNHNAIAAAIAQERADWGVAIRSVAEQAELGFLPVRDEQYDFVVPTPRIDRPAVQAFCRMLGEPSAREALAQLGCQRQ